jgi:hypothetical protein
VVQQVGSSLGHTGHQINVMSRDPPGVRGQQCAQANRQILCAELRAARQHQAFDTLSVTGQQLAGVPDLASAQRLQDQPVILVGAGTPAGIARHCEHQPRIGQA